MMKRVMGSKNSKDKEDNSNKTNTNPEKLTAIYTRVSTEEQAKEGISLSAQKDRLIAFCKAKDLSIYDIYTDDGYSAGSINRPALKKMLEDANQGKFKNVLVYKIDRFSRNLKDLIITLDEFQKKKINFISSTEPIDTTSAIGNAFMQIIGVFAQLERGMVAERVKLSFEKKLSSKEFINRPPLGYRVSKKKLIINNQEAQIVRKAFSMRVRGINYKDICKELRIPTSTFYHIIKNPTYIGYISYKNLLIKGNFPPLITRETFFKAHDNNKKYIFIDDNKSNRNNTDNKENENSNKNKVK